MRAWLHILRMEHDQEDVRVSLDVRPPFGQPGVDYSETYSVVTIPLYPVDERLARLLTAAKDLVASISFDDVGKQIAGHFIGGNGGLLSRATVQHADELRRAVAAIEGVEKEEPA